ncbi:hypothetical protein diail_7853 [Diaporthe ilicicola]|nr:hypothetical protein diail_7853 [Diaporthe ilicicola]
MASCSRGYGFGRDILLLLPRPSRSQSCFQPCATRLYNAHHIIRATRAFETSAHLRAKRKPAPSSVKQKPAPQKPSPPVAPYRQPTATTTPAVAAAAAAASSSSSSPGAASVAQRLAKRGEPTVLYESPSHFWLRASGLSASLFCTGYVGVHYWNIMVHPPEGLAWWVPHAFVPILLLMGYFGGHFALGAANIVSSIRALPRETLPRSYLTGGKAKRSKEEERSLVALNASPVALEVSLSQILPLLPPKKIVVAPSEVALPFKMQATPVGKGEIAGPRVEEGGERGVMDKIAAPFEALGRVVKAPFGGIARGLTQAGFSKIKVKGRKYKIDVLGGKVLENGKILDHLVTYQQNRSL